MVISSGSGSPSTVLGPRRARPAQPQMSAARRGVLHALIGAGNPVTVATLADRLGQHPNTIREHLDRLVAADRAERLRSRPVGRGRPAWLYRAVGPADSTTRPRNGAAHPDRISADGYGDDDYGDDVGGGDGLDGADGTEYAALALALIEEVGSSNPNPRAVARQAGERWGRTLAGRHREEHRAGPGTATTGTATTGTATTRTALPEPGDRAPRPSDAVMEMLADLRFEPQPTARPAVVRLTTCPLLDAARRNPDLVCQVHLGIVRGALEHVGGDPEGVALEPFAEPGACLLTLPDRR